HRSGHRASRRRRPRGGDATPAASPRSCRGAPQHAARRTSDSSAHRRPWPHRASAARARASRESTSGSSCSILASRTERNPGRFNARHGSSGRLKIPTGTKETHMLDRRKIIALIIGGVLVLALIIAAIAFVVTNQNGDSAPREPAATSTPSSSPSAGDEAAEAIDTFETDYFEMAREAAVIATSWDGLTDPEVRVARYKQAGLADDLAETFTPVWADIFGENKIAEVTTTVDNNL